MEVVNRQKVHRVIVAMPDRRGTIPMRELLDLRMRGVKIEEATSWLEKISGKIEVENLYPSWLIFGEGFRRSSTLLCFAAYRSISLVGLVVSILWPVLILVTRVRPPGPVFSYSATSGEGWNHLSVLKFHYMRQDAKLPGGPQWRITQSTSRASVVPFFGR
jgi:hypothetical protein